jgi:alpha-tubulin suppressor-like RCC1 family protein
MGVPKGQPTSAWFEWGTDRTYGNTTTPQDIGNGLHVVRVTEQLQNLAVGGVYHFRLVCSNASGVTRGFDSMFTTSMKIQTWGSFSDGLPVVPFDLTNLSGVGSGHRTGLALRNDGTVAAWKVGSTFFTPDRGQADVPPGLSNVVAVTGGYTHSLALKEDGTVVSWGKYGDGNLPTVPSGITNVIAVGGGDDFTAALKADGTVVAWGRNQYGNETNVPANLSDVVAISCGSGHTLALKADGTIAVWGNDLGGVAAPSSATNIVAVATMGFWNLALRGDGTIVDWGNPYYTDVPKPTNLTNIVAIVTGYGYAEALRADGTLVGWGRGQDATNISATLSNVVVFASGDYHRVGLAPTDLPPNCQGGSSSGGVNKALLISLSSLAYDLNGDALSFQISSLPAKGTLYQYSTNGLGSQITTSGTPLADARLFFVPAADDYGSPYDTFGFVAADGQLNSGPATFTIAIVPAPAIQVVFTNPVGPLTVSFAGLTNTGYSVWRSTNLISWVYSGAATQTSPGPFLFNDYAVTNSALRFYRISSP